MKTTSPSHRVMVNINYGNCTRVLLNSKATYQCQLLAAPNTCQLLAPNALWWKVYHSIQATWADGLGNNSLENQMGQQEKDTVTEKPLSHPSAGSEPQSREEARTAQALLPWLTLPLRPTQFPCAPPLLWPTCRGAALWLPWWPGPAPARVRRQHCQWRKQLLLKVAKHMPAEPWDSASALWGSRKTWNGLTVPFRGCFSFSQSPHLSRLLSNNNICGRSRLALNPSRALTARPGKRICSDLSILTYHLRLNAQAKESMFRSVVRREGMVYSIELTLHTQVTLAIDQLPEPQGAGLGLTHLWLLWALSNCLSKMFVELKNVSVKISINF